MLFGLCDLQGFSHGGGKILSVLPPAQAASAPSVTWKRAAQDVPAPETPVR